MIRFGCCLVALLLAGCSASKTSPVSGVVLLDGKPLPDASIQFTPTGAGREATGQTDRNGEFTMSTFEPRDGMLPGEYKVVVSPPLAAASAPTKFATSEEAMAAASKAPPPPKSNFPEKYTRPDLTPLTQTVPVQGTVKFELSSK